MVDRAASKKNVASSDSSAAGNNKHNRNYDKPWL